MLKYSELFLHFFRCYKTHVAQTLPFDDIGVMGCYKLCAIYLCK